MRRAISKSTLCLVLAVLLMPQAIWAGENGDTKTKTNATLPASREAILIKQRDALRVAGFNSLYNVDYDQAQNAFEKIVSLDPEHPAGYLYQAINIWLRITYSSRRLHTALYSNSDFESDLVKGPAQVEAKLEKQFYSLLDTSRQKAEARVKKDSKDKEALYLLAAAYSTQAGYEATIADKYFAALRNSSKAIELNKKVLKLDPNFVDAYLTVGIYDYVVANLPLAFRMMGSVFGLRGSKSRGIASLERVAKEGHYSSDDARLVLATIYQREKRYDDSLKMLQELQERYPKNCLPQLEIAALLIRTNRKEEAFKALDQLLVSQDSKQSIDLIHFHYGDALLASGKFTEASQQFLGVLEVKNCDKQLQALAHFRAGQAFDLAKNRDLAVEQYKQVLNCDNPYNIHARAREYMKKPYVKE